MKSAIDNYDIGKQQEFSANRYSRNRSYPKGRFRCPECGEDVFLTGRNNENHFSHFQKTETSAECDRRVDGNSSLTIYERVGLPLYLRKREKGLFDLYMGFRAIPVRLLCEAERREISIKITSNDKKFKENRVVYYINKERFHNDGTTYLQVNFIPEDNRKYQILYSGSFSNSIKSYWSDYADGFSEGGALFAYFETGGRKLRHWDTISTNTKYYWVRKSRDYVNISGISMEFYGYLFLKHKKLYVYVVSFDVSASSPWEFEKLSNYIRDTLKLTLLIRQPELIPVWPPAFKNGDMYNILPISNEVHSIIKSGNENPAVYAYRGVGYIDEDYLVQTRINSSNLISFKADTVPILLNIDRKMIGTGIYITMEKPNLIELPPMVNYLQEDGTIIDLMDIGETLNINSRSITIKAGHKIDLIIIKSKMEIDIYSITNDDINRLSVDYNDDVYILSQSHILINLKIIKSIISDNNEYFIDNDNLFFQLKKNSTGPLIPIPYWVGLVYEDLKKCNKSRLYLSTYFTKGYMPKKLIKTLQQWRED